MRRLVAAALVALGCGTVTAGCPAPATPTAEPVTVYGRSAGSSLSGAPRDIESLARGFLVPPPHEAPDGFGYYVYLLFTSKTGSNRPKRVAAAAAFLRLFNGDGLLEFSQSNSGSLPPRSKVAVLLAPLRFWPGSRPRAEELVDTTYDYGLALEVYARLSRANVKVTPLALVGSTQRLTDTAPIDGRRVFHTDLCDPARADKKIAQLQRELLVPDSEVLNPRFAPIERLRRYFEEIGTIVGGADAGSIAACE
jgi:hypothetical protein